MFTFCKNTIFLLIWLILSVAFSWLSSNFFSRENNRYLGLRVLSPRDDIACWLESFLMDGWSCTSKSSILELLERFDLCYFFLADTVDF
jgi:hypothetical protein